MQTGQSEAQCLSHWPITVESTIISARPNRYNAPPTPRAGVKSSCLVLLVLPCTYSKKKKKQAKLSNYNSLHQTTLILTLQNSLATLYWLQTVWYVPFYSTPHQQVILIIIKYTQLKRGNKLILPSYLQFALLFVVGFGHYESACSLP